MFSCPCSEVITTVTHTVFSLYQMHLWMYSCIHWATPSVQLGNATTTKTHLCSTSSHLPQQLSSFSNAWLWNRFVCSGTKMVTSVHTLFTTHKASSLSKDSLGKGWILVIIGDHTQAQHKGTQPLYYQLHLISLWRWHLWDQLGNG